MKKVYTLIGASLLSGGMIAQTVNGPVATPNLVDAKAKQAISGKHVNVERAKGTAIWEDDFSVPSNWVINNDAGNNDDWVIGTGVPSGAFAIAGIMSSSAANGFGLFDSDLLCSGNQDANLTTAAPISTIGEPNVKLEFEQYYRKYQGFTYIEVSNDGGANWTQFEVNSTYAVNESSATNPEVVSVNISSVAGNQAAVLIRFNYVGGCDYAWMVDDVALYPAPPHELTLSESGYPSATQDPYSGNFITYHNYPISQISPIRFYGDICNVGSADQTNVALGVAIPSDAYVGTSAVAALNAGACDSFETSTTWTPTAAVATHDVTMSIAYDSVAMEATPGNNTMMTTIAVSNGDYETFPNDWGGSGLWNGDDGNGNTTAFEMGNSYQFTNADVIDAVTVVFSSNTTVGTIAYAVVYEVDLVNGDFIYVDQTPDYTITAADLANTGPDPVRVVFPLSSPITAAAGSQYLVCVGHYGGQDEMIVANANGPVADQTVFLLDGSDNTWYYMTSNPMVGIATENSDIGIGIEENADNGIRLNQNMPNPFNGTTTISYELPAVANVTLEVMDITGKQVALINEGQKAAGTHTIELNAALPAGTYTYSLIVDGNRITKRMVVTK